MLGVAQEHHANRCRLFAQWKGLDFPILHDPINFMGTRGVPIAIAIDEHGIVRDTRPKPENIEANFLDKTFEAPQSAATKTAKPSLSDVEALGVRAKQEKTADAWRALGDTLALWYSSDRIDDAIDAYTQAARIDQKDGAALFRLGVCYSLRNESERRRPDDFQNAVDRWGQALATNPSQYIWRRRIQQYGPRLDKPYPFYDWVAQATTEIKARGDTPVALRVPPSGSEIARPIKQFQISPEKEVSPDPEGFFPRDKEGYVKAEVTVVPSRVRPGESARVHVAFHPSAELKAHWNNEADPLRLWIDLPEGWQADHRLLAAPQPKESQSSEVRSLEFDLQPPKNAPAGPARIATYALYYVCEDVDGACWLLRQDVDFEIDVAR